MSFNTRLHGVVSVAAISLAALALAGTAHAQTIPGVCLNTDLVSSYKELYGRNITSPECLASHYNNGRWSSKAELKGYIQAYQGSLHAAPAPAPAPAPAIAAKPAVYIDLPNQLLIDRGTSTPLSQVELVGTDGKLLSASAIAALVAQGGGNLVAQGGGNLVAQGGGNFHLQSVGGAPAKKKYVFNKK